VIERGLRRRARDLLPAGEGTGEERIEVAL
jgi:hypothetical protein